jgi:hypothetical protein
LPPFWADPDSTAWSNTRVPPRTHCLQNGDIYHWQSIYLPNTPGKNPVEMFPKIWVEERVIKWYEKGLLKQAFFNSDHLH